MDENTRYSLRLLGRGSVVVVSVALILAIIGYIKRDDHLLPGTVASQYAFTAQDFLLMDEDMRRTYENQRITIHGVTEKTYAEGRSYVLIMRHKTADGKIMFKQWKETVPHAVKPGDTLIVKGTYRGGKAKKWVVDRCEIVEN